jgi:glycosyltransferase involved in cell wall biosynthesis
VGEDQGYKKELIKLATDLDVFDKCVFTGRVTEKELLRYYSIADAFILPSTGEGFGLVALEAIVSGTPVILASTGGLKHIVSEIGGYPLDMAGAVSEQIAETVKKVFFDPDVKKEIEREKEVINWKRVAEMTEKVYEGLV